MSCILKLKQNYLRLTPKEKVVADYILDNPQNLIDLSVKELAENSNSSTGAVIRLFKKLNYESYNKMKLDMVKSDLKEEEISSFIINEGDSITVMAKKLENIIHETVSAVVNTCNFNKLESLVVKLQKAESIYLFGIGSSAIIAMDLQSKLIRLNKKVFFHQDSHTQISSSVFANENDVVIAFSYSGQTKEVNLAVKNAKENGAFIIGVTKSASSLFADLCDHVFYLPNNEGEFRLGAVKSRYAEFVVSDLLYFIIAQKDFEQTKQYIIKTRNAVKSIKKSK